MSPEEEVFRAGTTIGKHKTDKCLKKTIFSTVYLVQSLTEKHLVLKVPKRGVNSGEEELFAHLSLQKCPFIVNLVDHFVFDERTCLVMPECSGRDLYSFLSDSRLELSLDVHTMKKFAKRLLVSLAFIHELGFVFRDVKLENILLDTADLSWTSYLCDFGLCMQVGQRLVEPEGTWPYKAPEMIQEKTYGTEIDMWAFGCVLYAVFAKVMPFRPCENSDKEEYFRNVVNGEVNWKILDEWINHYNEIEETICRVNL